MPVVQSAPAKVVVCVLQPALPEAGGTLKIRKARASQPGPFSSLGGHAHADRARMGTRMADHVHPRPPLQEASKKLDVWIVWRVQGQGFLRQAVTLPKR